MKIRILLIMLCLYANCHGGSRSNALTSAHELNAQQRATIHATVNADRKVANDVATKACSIKGGSILVTSSSDGAVRMDRY